MKCEDSYKDLGCFSHCHDINTGLIARKTGIHKVFYKLCNTKQVIPFSAIEGEEIIIPNKLKENLNLVFKIQEPDGGYYDTLCLESDLDSDNPAKKFVGQKVKYHLFRLETAITFNNEKVIDLGEMLADQRPELGKRPGEIKVDELLNKIKETATPSREKTATFKELMTNIKDGI